MQAWHEVVNALVAYRLEQQRRTQLKLQIDYSRQALTAARERCSDGAGDFLTVLDAERTLLQAGQQYVTSTTNVSLKPRAAIEGARWLGIDIPELVNAKTRVSA